MALPKVGVLTFHRSINYGSFWQAARLVEGLRSRGHEIELLDHECRAVCSAELRCALQPELPKRTSGRLLNRYATKARKLAKAIDRLPLSSRFPLQQPELAGDYDIIVVGSDEVWNFRHPWFGSKPIFFGDGLRTPRLVSYAASFGSHGRGDGIAEDWARKLERFASLSVRDGNSEALVRDGTAREPAIALLKEDHQMLRALFDMIETADDDVVFPIAGEICVRLAIHMAVEEHLFYPALKSVIDINEIDEGIVEHEVTKRLISDIMEMTGREELFRARVHVLGEQTVHHIDEEDRVLFRDARKAWEEGKIDLVQLGTEMSRHWRELFDLVGSAAADTRAIDVELVGKTIEELPASSKRNGVAARVPAEEV